MRISGSQMERLEWGEEELRSLTSLLEEVMGENQDASGTELRSLGIVWELVITAAKELKALRKRKEALVSCGTKPIL